MTDKENAISSSGLPIGWKDLIARFASQKTNITNEPTWEDTGNGIFMYSFVDGNEVFAQYHVGHDYKLGTKAFAHIHFFSQATMAVGETVEWTFKYAIAKGHQQGESLTVPTTDIIMTYTADGTEVAGEHIILECSELQSFELYEADTVLITSTAKTGGTHSGKIFGIMADIHYQSDHETTVSKIPDFDIAIP